jgi:hypothetical protein
MLAGRWLTIVAAAAALAQGPAKAPGARRPAPPSMYSSVAPRIPAAAPSPSDADGNPHLWRPQTKTVAVFKNGLGFFMREGEVTVREGWCLAKEVQPAVSHQPSALSHEAPLTGLLPTPESRKLTAESRKLRADSSRLDKLPKTPRRKCLQRVDH